VNTGEQYVCAFRGRRDYYHVPLGLAEGGLLDQFITDGYGTPAVRALANHVSSRWLDRLALRHQPGIPAGRVRCLWDITAREEARHALGLSPDLTRLRYDHYFSEAAAARARTTRANLLLYSPYAWEAFVAKYPHQPRRILFQYHPHPETERRLLADDARQHPGPDDLDQARVTPPPGEALIKRERDCWQHADLIICSSAFTRQSLMEAGCPESRCVIIPYGVDLPDVTVPAVQDSFRVLFVGAGSRRKGLGHLLHAWRHAQLPVSSRLTLVCRVIDPQLEALARETPRVELLRGANPEQLSGLYASSALFAMPSLVEGFGLVYLEALSHGCPVLGTPNTGVPDLGAESNGIFVTPAGQRDALIATLERLSASLVGAAEIRRAARSTAERYPWSGFRAAIRDTVRRPA
jgi:glycosyltransferase involved in cell wall biosynthesis